MVGIPVGRQACYAEAPEMYISQSIGHRNNVVSADYLLPLNNTWVKGTQILTD